MTTKITVHANHGWPVDVTVMPPPASQVPDTKTRVAAGETREFFVHSGADLLVHEVQLDEEPAAAPAGHAPLPVAGYTAQSDERVALVNANKQAEELVLRILDDLATRDVDKRWLALGRTGIEQAFMAINRAVFRPQRIALPGDAP